MKKVFGLLCLLSAVPVFAAPKPFIKDGVFYNTEFSDHHLPIDPATGKTDWVRVTYDIPQLKYIGEIGDAHAFEKREFGGKIKYTFKPGAFKLLDDRIKAESVTWTLNSLVPSIRAQRDNGIYYGVDMYCRFDYIVDTPLELWAAFECEMRDNKNKALIEEELRNR